MWRGWQSCLWGSTGGSLLSADDGYVLCPGAAGGEVAAAETAPAAVFGGDLREVYLASDGVFDRPGQWFVIWPLSGVATRRRQAGALEGSPVRRGLVGFRADATGAPSRLPPHCTRPLFPHAPLLPRPPRS